MGGRQLGGPLDAELMAALQAQCRSVCRTRSAGGATHHAEPSLLSPSWRLLCVATPAWCAIADITHPHIVRSPQHSPRHELCAGLLLTAPQTAAVQA